MTPEDRLGHRQRLREKFANYEQDAFLDYELLELILTYSIPRRDVKHIAKVARHPPPPCLPKTGHYKVLRARILQEWSAGATFNLA